MDQNRKLINDEIVTRVNEFHWHVEDALKAKPKYHRDEIKLMLLHYKKELFRKYGLHSLMDDL